MNEVKQVYKSIVAVMKKLAVLGITKDRTNQSQGYKFRGIDDVYNALAPILADEGLCILPSVLGRVVTERTTKDGKGALLFVTVQVDHVFVSSIDGSEHHVITYGEAMDSGDKATNKAMSAAYKYAAIEAFCIPTEGDNDADSKTHEIAKEYITEKQAGIIRDQLIELKRDEAKFLGFLKVNKIEEILASDYERVNLSLEQYRTKLKEKENKKEAV